VGSDKTTIVFEAQVAKVQTLADGGIRLVLDLPETAVPQAAMLMQCKADGIALLVTAKATI
jgi:hypothetical protein